MEDRIHHILISFSNVTPGAPSLALLDCDNGALSILDVPEELSFRGGVSGLAVTDRYVFAVTTRSHTGDPASGEPRGPSTLTVFDRRNLIPLSRHVFTRIFDAHSICAGPDRLDIVSTGTDEVVRVTLDGSTVLSEDLLWRPDAQGPRADVYHLNAILAWQGDLLVSGFGRRSGPLWSSATEGFIASVGRDTILASGMRHPHSLFGIGDRLAYCESGRAEVRFLGADLSVKVPGYARGLTRVEGTLYVGTNRGRRASRSTGLLTTRADPGPHAGDACIVRVRLDNWAIEQVIDVRRIGWELYDLVPVADVERWPVLEALEWRDRLIEGLRSVFEGRDSTITWLHQETTARDAEIAKLHDEVAGRHRSIDELHREVAERDWVIRQLRGNVDPV